MNDVSSLGRTGVEQGLSERCFRLHETSSEITDAQHRIHHTTHVHIRRPNIINVQNEDGNLTDRVFPEVMSRVV
jgi:hypothetical protein